MTLAEEQALLTRFARRAGAAERLNVHDLKAAYEKAIGHPTSDSTIFNLLHSNRHRRTEETPIRHLERTDWIGKFQGGNI